METSKRYTGSGSYPMQKWAMREAKDDDIRVEALKMDILS
jgi:hypothetical protein